MTTFGPQVCGDLEAGARREWLVPDGVGGFAMGTVSGLRTRRYHGLLVVAPTPAHRMLALASLDAVLTTAGGIPVQLATHEWSSGVVAPHGHELLESFELRDALPTWRWRLGDVVLERTVALTHGAPAVAVVYTLLSGGSVELTLEPLCTWRTSHGERHEHDGLAVSPTVDGFVVEDAYRVAGPGFVLDPAWYADAFHREESARGLAPGEDLLRVGRFTATLATGESVAVRAWAGDLATPPPPGPEVVAAARQRAARVTAGRSGAEGRLALAADAFIVDSPTGPDVVAGYPWFGAWSRDTMISYEGLFLTTGRADQGRELLRGYARTLSGGMLANTADTGSVSHNTADATLWFLHAVDRHVVSTGDSDLAAELVDPLDEVIRHHLAGTRYNIRVDPDGLLTQGADGVALSWMDAVVPAGPVTPRRGKAVELNALWLNGLAAVAGLRDRLGRDHADLDALRERGVESFRRRFPGPDGWLLDVLDTDEGRSLRPNQLLAYGLPYAPMVGTDPVSARSERQRAPQSRTTVSPVPVRAAGRALLTPLGPRSLSPDDHRYLGHHEGGPVERDVAYHQGTVWPWLIGPYADAARAVGLPTTGLLTGLLAHLDEWGVGSISETADGDPPHAATGCPFQAWSVAETLRTLVTHGP